MAKVSAGILLHRDGDAGVEVLLVHPGGPFWAKRDLGAWSIPKGELDGDEEPAAAARRELVEELGADPLGDALLIELGEVTQRGGKRVTAWAARADFDPAELRSNEFEIEWPPRSGRRRFFPEVDRATWFGLEAARERIVEAQAAFLDRLHDHLAR